MNKQKKAYFVHIPKTGGNTIRFHLGTTKIYHDDGSYDEASILINPGKKKSEREHHWGIRNAKRIAGSHPSFKTDTWPCYVDTEEYKKADFSFTCLRNPFGLLFSYYRHYFDHTESKGYIDAGWANCRNYHKIDTFENFIDLYTSMDPEEWHVPALSRNLFGQIFNDEGEIAVDYLILNEMLQQGITAILLKADAAGWGSSSAEDIAKEWAKAGGVVRNNMGPKYEGSLSDHYSSSMIKKVKKKCEWELETFKYTIDENSGLGHPILSTKKEKR